VLDPVLVAELADAQDDGEADAGVAEGVEPDDGLMVRHGAVDLGHRFGDDLVGHPLHVLQVAVVGHPDLDQDGQLFLGAHEVGHVRLRELTVGEDDQVVGQVADRRLPPVDVLDVALLAAAELDVVTGLDGLGGEDVDAREEVGEGVLQRQRDRQAADAQGGEHRGYGDPQRLQHHQEADRQDQDPGDVDEDRGRSGDTGTGLGDGAHQSGDHPRRRHRRHEDEQHGEHLVGAVLHRAGQRQHRCRARHAAHDRGPGHHGPQCVHDHVIAGPAGAVGVPAQPAQQQAQRERRQQARGEGDAGEQQIVHGERPVHRSPPGRGLAANAAANGRM
jgi:hypothetical protein